MDDVPQNDDQVPVVDRRRFSQDGERLDETPDAGDEPVGAAPDEHGVGAERLRIAEELAAAAEERAASAERRLLEVKLAYREARAELDATRARLERDQEQRIREALGRSYSGILVALDSLELALEHAGDDPLSDGVRLSLRQIMEALGAEGVERIDVLGKPFDPAVAEAVAVVPVDDPALNDAVVDEIRSGFLLRGQLLRAAQVRVGRHAEAGKEPAG